MRRDTLVFEGKTLEINDLFTSEFYQFSDKKVDQFKGDIPIINEIYLSKVQIHLALILFFKKNNIQEIVIDEVDDSLYPLVVDTAKKLSIKVHANKKIINYKKVLKGHVYIIVSVLFLLWKMLLVKHSYSLTSNRKKTSIVRSPASRQKMEKFEDIYILIEDFKSERSIYKYFSKLDRLLWVFKSWMSSYVELKKYKNFTKEKIGKNSGIDVFVFYSKRIVHTLLYQHILNQYFTVNRKSTFYTGNNLDRFALVEELVARKYKVNTVCIPHGIEYGFKLPHCFTGNTFYTTSKEAEKHLNLIYKENKFKYAKEIAEKMFSFSFENKSNRRVVFFTEPREVNVNLKIIDEILPLMERESILLYIKLHPKDSKNNYKKYGDRLNFIENIIEALTGNVCFSRKSTTLLEAVYNNSKVSSIITNEKDKAILNTFPSLQDEKIEVFHDSLNLFEWIKTQVNITKRNREL
jgi:hypothetical protein